MIAYLEGKIIKKTLKSIILLCEKVGYLIYSNNKILSKINENQEYQLYVHNHIREDQNDLYGFETFEDLEFFKQLISVSGIGPKVGLEICNIDTNKFKSAILNEEIEFICKVPGIGKKTAQRLVLELKGKINFDKLESTISEDAHLFNEDIIDALSKLGYQRKNIISSLKKLPENLKKEEEIITYFLKNN